MTEQRLREWLTEYGKAWVSCDADAAANLFSEDAAYHETPFGEPAHGRSGIRAYWTTATAGQRDIAFRHDVLAVAASAGIARWSAEFTRRASGARVSLDGVFLLEFNEEGLCRELREWWHRREQDA